MQTVSFDEDYVSRLAARDPLVEQHFCTYFGELLLIKLRSQVRSRELAEDIRQETLLRVIRNLRTTGMDQPERLGAYVFAVCKHVMLEKFRAEGRYAEMNEDGPAVPESAASADEALLSGERRRQVLKVMGELPERDAELLRAAFLEEAEKDELCGRFGVDRNYLRVLLHRARLRFKELYLKTYAASV